MACADNLDENQELWLEWLIEGCKFSDKFKKDKLHSRLIEVIKSKEYYNIFANAYESDGIYTKSMDYLKKFNVEDISWYKVLFEEIRDTIIKDKFDQQNELITEDVLIVA